LKKIASLFPTSINFTGTGTKAELITVVAFTYGFDSSIVMGTFILSFYPFSVSTVILIKNYLSFFIINLNKLLLNTDEPIIPFTGIPTGGYIKILVNNV
jgi:hypothetical protein